MQSQRQQLLLQLFRERPQLIETVLYDWLRVHLAYDAVAPRYSDAQPFVAEPAAAEPAPGAASNVFVLKDAQGAAAQLVVLEVRLEIDEQAKQSWPAQIWNLRGRQSCKNVWLVVIAGDAQVAEWAREPVATGPHWFAPLVVSPDRVPSADAGALEEPEATFLAAALQARNGSFPSQPDWAMNHLRTAQAALRQLNSPHADDYQDMLARPLFAIAATLLEELSDKYWGGYRKAISQAALRLLEGRFATDLTQAMRARMAASSIETLDRLVKDMAASPNAALEEVVTPLYQEEDESRALTSRVERIQKFLAEESPYSDEFVHWFCWRWARQDSLSKLVLRQLRLKGGVLPAGAADRVLIASEAELTALGIALVTKPLQELQTLLVPHEDRRPLHRIGEEFLTSPAILDPYKNEGGPWQRFLIARSARDESQSSLVLRQLEARFGPLPAELASSLGREDGRDISEVGERLVNATSLVEALGEPRQGSEGGEEAGYSPEPDDASEI